MQDYHQLDIWNRAMDYTVNIYRFSADLPDNERYNLVSQLRRAQRSVNHCSRQPKITDN
jgi:four helix bundle protein